VYYGHIVESWLRLTGGGGERIRLLVWVGVERVRIFLPSRKPSTGPSRAQYSLVEGMHEYRTTDRTITLNQSSPIRLFISALCALLRKRPNIVLKKPAIPGLGLILSQE
jgi:hypothetical protein